MNIQSFIHALPMTDGFKHVGIGRPSETPHPDPAFVGFQAELPGYGEDRFMADLIDHSVRRVVRSRGLQDATLLVTRLRLHADVVVGT